MMHEAMMILTSLMERELKTVEGLGLSIEGFYKPLSNNQNDILSISEHWSMFANLEAVRDAQCTVLKRLQTVLSKMSKETTSPTDPPALRPPCNESPVPSMQHQDIIAAFVTDVLCDGSMETFLSEHSAYTVAYCRTIAPKLLGIMRSQEVQSNAMKKFVQFTQTMMDAYSFPDTHLPEYDPLNVAREQKISPALEQLLVILAYPLSTALRYIHAARCLQEMHCVAGLTVVGKLATFVQTATRHQLETSSMAHRLIASYEAARIISSMEEPHQMPPREDRLLIHRGRIVKKFGRGRHERLMFLFSDCLCYTEELDNSKLRVRGLVPLDAQPIPQVVDVDDRYFEQLQNCFNVLTQGKTYVFFANSRLEKARWIECIHRQLSVVQASVMQGKPTTEPKRAPRSCGARSRLQQQRHELGAIFAYPPQGINRSPSMGSAMSYPVSAVGSFVLDSASATHAAGHVHVRTSSGVSRDLDSELQLDMPVHPSSALTAPQPLSDFVAALDAAAKDIGIRGDADSITTAESKPKADDFLDSIK